MGEKRRYLNIFTARFVVGLFCLVFIVAGIFFLRNRQRVPYWQDLEISPIHLNGIQGDFAVKNGKIYKNGKAINQWLDSGEYDRTLKLALFFQWTKEDPLLFDSNLDKDSFDQALARLKEQDGILDASVHLGDLHPIAFLQSFSDASLEYQVFSKDISEVNAEALLSAEKKAQENYANDAQRSAKLLKETISDGQGKSKLAFLGGETISTIEIMSADFDKIEKNATFLTEEIRKRENCLEKMECQRPISFFAKPETGQENPVPEITNLPIDEINIDGGMQIDGGPFLVHSGCWRDRTQDLLYETKRCGSTQGFCLDWPALSDGGYWMKNIDQAGGSSFIDQGVLRRPQSESAPYGCMDLTYKPTLRTIEFAMENYKSNRFFDKNVPAVEDKNLQKELRATWTDGKQFEDAFFDAQYPSDSALENLGQYYSYAYSFLVEKNVPGDNPKEELLQRTNVLKGKMQDFNFILDRSTYHFKDHLQQDIVKMAALKNPKYYYVYDLLAIRGNYSIAFLNFSPFVWRISEKPQYFLPPENKTDSLQGISDENIPVISNEKAIQLYGKEKLKEWIDFSIAQRKA